VVARVRMAAAAVGSPPMSCWTRMVVSAGVM
jgi:hypothetical protein